MYKKRRKSSAFNPEKVLAKNAKKTSKASLQRKMSLYRAVAMADGLKKSLYADLQKEKPEFFVEGAVLMSVENPDVIEAFLRSAFAKQKLTFSDEVFGALFGDFFRGLVLRLMSGSSDD